MSVSLKREQLQTLARLARTPDGQMLLQMLKTWQSDVDQSLRRLGGEEMLRAQGDAQRLEELIGYLEGGADRRLNDLSAPRRPVTFAPHAA